MNIAVAQSGGPTCAINASLLGVIKEALKNPEIRVIYGSVNGIEGIINDRMIDLKAAIHTNEDMELLRQTPSTVLGSCRYKLPELSENAEIYQKIANASSGIKSVPFSISAETIRWTRLPSCRIILQKPARIYR